jgi:cytochrome bd-type quinol oxidase subunit 2
MEKLLGVFFFIAILLAVFFIGNSKSAKSMRSNMTKQDKILTYITVAIVLVGEFLLVALLNNRVINKEYGIIIFCVYPLVVIIFSTLFYYLVLKTKKK